MDFRKGIISTALSLTLLMPSVSLASNPIHLVQEGKVPITTNASTEENLQNPKPQLSPEAKAKFQELKNKFKNGEITKDQFHQEMKKLMPENHHCKHKKKCCDNKMKLSDEDKAKLDELKTKLKNGEITKKEFKEEVKQLKWKSDELKEE
ncbi:hypothetical protein CACET_c29630 [Clostridium aceticum]|uniref:Uncharacterized protein n=1 Tax=Clostridium aceticum TaxID=84022 RepID=A0A0D8I9L7_9CLOT|nr:SHOCT domain-containing protein [Clostridium aceticum]AKL96407.1 hypothetical protein CACET_c29630 [Clostridium aceticum]KJF26980.1 hypothetical protein TZ02_10685 [Clostridium aceticum]